MKDVTNRNKFLERVKHNKQLDALDKAAIREAILLQSLKSHQREASHVIGILFEAKLD